MRTYAKITAEVGAARLVFEKASQTLQASTQSVKDAELTYIQSRTIYFSLLEELRLSGEECTIESDSDEEDAGGRAHPKVRQPRLHPSGGPNNSVQVLKALEEEPSNCAALSEKLGWPREKVSNILSRLDRRGFVHRPDHNPGSKKSPIGEKYTLLPKGTVYLTGS